MVGNKRDTQLSMVEVMSGVRWLVVGYALAFPLLQEIRDLSFRSRKGALYSAH